MVNKRKVKKGVILAAGDGDRLGSITAICPKVLLPVNGAPLISYPIEAMVSAGISEIAIVVGYLGDKVIKALGDGSNFGTKLQYILNSDYLKGNAISVYSARDWAQEDPIVLCMGDHIIERKIIERLLDRHVINETLCIDYAPAYYHQVAEATKVSLDSVRCINNIGKDITDWDALDTGVFLLTGTFFWALGKLIHHLGTNIEISDVIRFLISQEHRFDTCDVSGCFWKDIDTKQDLDLVRM